MISDTILLEQHSDDVLFSFAHWFSFSSSHKKSASCVISILPQLTDFLQTFFSEGRKAATLLPLLSTVLSRSLHRVAPQRCPIWLQI